MENTTNEVSQQREGGVKMVSGRQALVTCFSDIQPIPVSWLWPGRFALGKLSLIAGDPGLGKSLLTAAMSAVVSKGYKWPLCSDPAPIGDVILLSAEDDPADTIRPRLDAAEADCDHVFVLQAIEDKDEKGNLTRSIFSLKRDIAILENILDSKPNCQLVIIDPISSYLDGTDSHNNSDVRGLLAPLAELAVRRKVAIVLIHHLNKNAGSNALYRTMGSLAFTAAVRSAYVVTKDKDNPSRRLLMPTKNNLAKDLTGLAYSIIENENRQPVIAWDTEPVTITADDALAIPEQNEEHTDTDWAVLFLEDVLASGPALVSKIQREAREAGVKEKPLRLAREKLGIKPKKLNFTGGWSWELPVHQDAQIGEYATTKNEGTLGVEGQLQTRTVVKIQSDGNFSPKRETDM